MTVILLFLFFQVAPLCVGRAGACVVAVRLWKHQCSVADCTWCGWETLLFVTADVVTEVTPRNPPSCDGHQEVRDWLLNTLQVLHFDKVRFYSPYRLLIVYFNVWGQVSTKIFISEHNFCHWSEPPPTPLMRRNLQCLSERDRTAVSQLFFFLTYYFVPVDKVGHTRIHINLHVCFQLLFLLTERWETEGDCQDRWDASSFCGLAFLNNIRSHALMLF